MVIHKCPYCGHVQSVWRGYRYNRASLKRLRQCSKCRRKFTPDDGFLRMRFDKEIIKSAVSLYIKGFSLAEVQKKLKREESIKVSRWTILCWYKRYGKGKRK